MEEHLGNIDFNDWDFEITVIKFVTLSIGAPNNVYVSFNGIIFDLPNPSKTVILKEVTDDVRNDIKNDIKEIGIIHDPPKSGVVKFKYSDLIKKYPLFDILD